MIKLAILASGTGSNAENIIRYFYRHPKIQVACVVSNRKKAKVLEKAEKLHIEHRAFSKQAFLEEETVVKYLQSRADFIILAGFLLKIPGNMLAAYPNKIINIHPALLPKFGGKGMYGMSVHKAVKDMGESETGITIHYINENYDEGAILFQAKTPVSKTDSPEDIAANIHMLERTHFPQVIEKTLT
jgi:phosphoribosylglycinamide formyltransferase-1